MNGDETTSLPSTALVESAGGWDRVLELISTLEGLPAGELDQRLEAIAATGESAAVIARVRLHLGIQRVPGTADELPPDTIVGGEYRITSRLGSGGMGVVYEAVLEKTGQTVALKMIQPGLVLDHMRDRFFQEMKALGRLDHPGIVQIRHAGHHAAGPGGRSSEFFTMERITGRSIREYLASTEATLNERLRIIRDAAIAVQYAHDRAVIHRDLKPGNMMIRQDGRIVIFDFGLSSALAFTEDTPFAIGAEGTPPYMAPEQAEAAPPAPAADIFSLGAILYEVLTGGPLYHHTPQAPRSAKFDIVRHPPPRLPLDLPDAPPALNDILDKALAREPEDRFSSAAAFARAINRLLPAHLVNEPPHKWHPVAGVTIPATDWVLEKKLGDGAHGQVWLARNRPVLTNSDNPLIPPPRVYKFCASEDAARSLRREQRVFLVLKRAADAMPAHREKYPGGIPDDPAATLPVEDIPGIVPLEAWSLDEPPYYIAMRWIEDSCDLREWVLNRHQSADPSPSSVPTDGQVFSEASAISIVCAVAAALQFASQNGVLHRDVSPANILVRNAPGGPGGVRAWLVDFGLAAFDANFAKSLLTTSITDTASARLVGSPEYIAPEIKRGSPATTQSDIYSLGVILYRLFRQDLTSTLTEWKQHIADPFLREDLERCLADNPENRFPSASALATSLRNLPSRRAEAAKAAMVKAAAEAMRQAELTAAAKAAYRKGIIRTAAIAAAVVAGVSGLAWFSRSQFLAAWQNESRLRLSEIRVLRESTQPARQERILARVAEAHGNYPPADIPALRNEVLAALSISSPAGTGEEALGKVPLNAAVATGGSWMAWHDGNRMTVAKVTRDGIRSLPVVLLPGTIARTVVSADGTLAAALTQNGVLVVTDGSGQLVQIEGEFGTEGLAVHPPGFVAVPGVGGQVNILSGKKGEWSKSFTVGTRPPVLNENATAESGEEPFTSSAELIAFSPDARYLAVAGKASLHVQVWEAGTGKRICSCSHAHIPTAIAWEPGPSYRLWSASGDGGVFGWDVGPPAADGRAYFPAVAKKPDSGAQSIRYIDASPEIPFLVCTAEDGSRTFLRKETLSVEELHRNSGAVASGFSQGSGNWTLAKDGIFRLNTPVGQPVLSRVAGDRPVLRLCQSFDGRMLAASCGSAVAVSDAASLGPTVILPASFETMGVAFSATAPEVFATGVSGSESWGWKSPSGLEAVFHPHESDRDVARGGEALSLRLDGVEWRVLSEGDAVEAYCSKSKTKWRFQGSGPVTALTSGRDTPWFAVAMYGAATTLCSPGSEASRPMPKHPEEVLGAACSPDGKALVERTASRILVTDPQSGSRKGEFLLPLPARDSRTGRHLCAPVAVSSSGLIAVSADHSRITLFRIGDADPVAELILPPLSAPTALLFTEADGLVAGTADGRLWLWRMSAMRGVLRGLKLDWDPPMRDEQRIQGIRPSYEGP